MLKKSWKIMGCSFVLFIGFLGNTTVCAVSATERPSLQRGARLFMNYCSGCHSLRYLRYSTMAKGLGLLDFDGQVDNDLLKNNLIFTEAGIHDPVRIALPPEDAKQWFGVVPPDLSLIAREKGRDWLYTYLNSFYNDNSRPFGTNNRLVPGVAMPDILEPLKAQTQFTQDLDDLITFLVYVGEPEKAQRYHIGPYVISFLLIFLLLVLGLKRVYWQKII